MVQAMVHLDEKTNRVLNIIKAQYGLKDKSQAIQVAVKGYEVEVMEPQFRPEYIKKIKRIEKTAKFIPVKDVRSYLKKLAEE
jgi:hypothetical protein